MVQRQNLEGAREDGRINNLKKIVHRIKSVSVSLQASASQNFKLLHKK